MKLMPTRISGGWVVEPTRHGDDRGWFQEWFKKSSFEEQIGFSFSPLQINISHSFLGVIRGIHYSNAPRGQAKLVSVMNGLIDDYIIDIRIDSPTFGEWECVRLSSDLGNSVLLDPHLAHAFHCVSDEARVCYAVSAEFNPAVELAINPLDPEININWDNSLPRQLSTKDAEAPYLAELVKKKMLPAIKENYGPRSV